MNSRGIGVISYSLVKSNGVVQVETCGPQHYLLYVEDEHGKTAQIALSRATARSIAKDILNHIEFMEEKERKEVDE